MTKRQSITENITEESRKVKMNIEEELDFEGKADKFITIFHKVFHEYHENRIKKEEGEANVNSHSVEGLVADFFSKLASKIRKIIKGGNEKNNKGIKFLKIFENFFHSIFDKAKNS